jgi:hypothetical protein
VVFDSSALILGFSLNDVLLTGPELNNSLLGRVHIYSNSPSPAVAIHGLKRAAKDEEDDFCSDVRRFVEVSSMSMTH